MRIPSVLARGASCALLFGVVLIAGCAGGRAASGVRRNLGYWPVYQGTPTHNAVRWANAPSPQWHRNIGARINGSLAIVGNSLVVDDLSGDVVSLNLNAGTLRWRTTLDNMVMTTPVIAQGMAIVGTGKNGAPGRAKTSFVYTSGTAPNALSLWEREEGDHIEALSLSSGRIVWKYRTEGEDMPSGVVVDGMYIFANGDAHAYALDTTTGIAKWRTTLPGISTMASALSIGKRVIASTCINDSGAGVTVALDANTGKILWKSDYGNCDSSPAYDDGLIFVTGISGNRAGFGFGGKSIVVALNATDGRLRWRYRSKCDRPFTSLASSERAVAGTIADGMLFQSLPQDDRLVAFDERSGAVKWSYTTTAPVKMSSVISHGRVYFGDTAGLFYVLDERTGALLRTRIFDQPFSTSPPILYAGSIIVANGTSINAIPVSAI